MAVPIAAVCMLTDTLPDKRRGSLVTHRVMGCEEDNPLLLLKMEQTNIWEMPGASKSWKSQANGFYLMAPE